ncbi:MAG: hypothetical protein IJ329_03340 [Clostridia bacterium]|nr:hypothetical protein [Clostridia bacterium]
MCFLRRKRQKQAEMEEAFHDWIEEQDREEKERVWKKIQEKERERQKDKEK